MDWAIWYRPTWTIILFSLPDTEECNMDIPSDYTVYKLFT